MVNYQKAVKQLSLKMGGIKMTEEEKMDALLLSLTDKEREVLSEKLNGKGNA
jgi:hypothetical protein